MIETTLKRLREGIADDRYTLTLLANESKEPLTTIRDMVSPEWKIAMFERLENIKKAMDRIDVRQRRQLRRQASSEAGDQSETAVSLP